MMCSNTEEKAGKIIRENNLRCTKNRLAILGILLDSDVPLTHEEILMQLRDSGINRVTIYRGLQSFLEKGIVHRVEAGDRLWRFAVCGCKSRTHCHPHFTCRACGRVECLFQYPLPIITDPAPGYQVEEQEVYLRGICADCSSKSPENFLDERMDKK